MIFAADWRRQARVCARLAEDCEDRHLAERLRFMSVDLAAKADEAEELPPSTEDASSRLWRP